MPDFGHIENAYRMLAADEASSVNGHGWTAERNGADVVIRVVVTARASASDLAPAVRPFPAIVERKTT